MARNQGTPSGRVRRSSTERQGPARFTISRWSVGQGGEKKPIDQDARGYWRPLRRYPIAAERTSWRKIVPLRELVRYRGYFHRNISPAPLHGSATRPRDHKMAAPPSICPPEGTQP